MHRDPGVFTNAEACDPDRWLPKRRRASREACIPFGAGNRKCIGDLFALTDSVIAIATVLARWQLVAVLGHTP